jgi:hypothetical protein
MDNAVVNVFQTARLRMESGRWDSTFFNYLRVLVLRRVPPSQAEDGQHRKGGLPCRRLRTDVGQPGQPVNTSRLVPETQPHNDRKNVRS